MLNDIIKGKKKIRKKNMVMTSVMEESGGQFPLLLDHSVEANCKTRENFNFLKKGKMVISVKIQNFSRSRMTKRTSPLESSREI